MLTSCSTRPLLLNWFPAQQHDLRSPTASPPQLISPEPISHILWLAHTSLVMSHLSSPHVQERMHGYANTARAGVGPHNIHDSFKLGQTKHPKPSGCFGGSPLKKRMQLVNVRDFVCVCVHRTFSLRSRKWFETFVRGPVRTEK